MDAAAVSVVVPVRDAERYLDESLRSIHEQTLHDFEVVVFDDGSTDRSIDIARNWADKDARFKLFSSSYPLGLTGSSNEAVRLSAAPIVARMDADDIAHPDRLRRQLHAILAADDVVIVGTLTDGIDRSGKRIKTRDRGRVLKPAPFHPFPHGSIMFRRAAFEAAGRYREAAVGWEELDLFLRMSEHGRVIVLLDRLYRYRYHAMGATITAGLESRARVNAIRARCIELYLCGKDYAAELHSGEPTPAELRRALVETISTRTAMQVWSGDRPVPPSPRTVLTGRLSDAARAAIYGWAGYVSPKGVRAIARNYGRIRDQAAARKLGNKDAVEWNFGRY